MDGPAGNRDAAQKDSPTRDHAAAPRVTTGVVVASHGPRWLTGSTAPLTSRPRSPEGRGHCACSPPSVAAPPYRDPHHVHRWLATCPSARGQIDLLASDRWNGFPRGDVCYPRSSCRPPRERTDTAMAAPAGQGSSAADRVRVMPVEGADTLFTPAFLAYLVRMHAAFAPRAEALRVERDRVLRRALEQGIMPGPAPESARAAGDWKVPPVPEDLRKPGIEISGPCSITSMFINALNPGPGGDRAEGDLDDDEDSAGHRLVDT